MRRSRLMAGSLVSALSLTLIAPLVAGSAAASDPRAEREQVRAEAARLAGDIDASKASVSEIDDALSAIEANLDTQQAALEKATADLEAAERDLDDAHEAIDELEDEIDILREEMGRRAVQTYVNPPEEELLSTLSSSDFTTATEQQFFVDIRSQDDADLEDRLTGAQVDLEAQREKAEDALERADTARSTQADKVEEVEETKKQHDTLLSELNSRLNDQIARSVELADTDEKLSKEIAKQEAELAARIAKAQAEQERREKEAAEASQIQTARPPSGGGGSAPPPPSGVTPEPSPGGVSVCNASGITVACSVAGQVNSMISAARAAGVNLTGSGYRSSQRQIELRIAHGCGGALVYDRGCRGTPLTAVPGRSQHEIGLAIDFNNCSSHGTDCFRWLASNAARFGFHNLPAEPWHWSTTGN